jgi:hypothetical protein
MRNRKVFNVELIVAEVVAASSNMVQLRVFILISLIIGTLVMGLVVLKVLTVRGENGGGDAFGVAGTDESSGVFDGEDLTVTNIPVPPDLIYPAQPVEQESVFGSSDNVFEQLRPLPQRSKPSLPPAPTKPNPNPPRVPHPVAADAPLPKSNPRKLPNRPNV